jgi:UDP-N-acetylglucosamine acyltransferase
VIHAQAIIDPSARIADGVSIGPFSVIGPDVEIGEHTVIGPHVVISGPTEIGSNNTIYQFTSLGEPPQHLGYKGEPTRLIIGNNNIIRESCTMNRGTIQGHGKTVVGDNNFIMAYSHIAHDCSVGNHTIFANGSSLAGHVEVGDYAILGGFTMVHQFCRIGAHSITGISTVTFKDVPPFLLVSGNTAQPYGLNLKGLKRRDFTDEDIDILKKAYKILYRSGKTVEEAIESLNSLSTNRHLQALIKFISESERGIVR